MGQTSETKDTTYPFSGNELLKYQYIGAVYMY